MVHKLKYKFTNYFLKVLIKRPYIQKEWCYRIIEKPIKTQAQSDGERIRFWGRVEEYNNKVFRIVTLSDGVTIHNAFPDRGYKDED